MLEIESLKGKTFLDIGSGSGIHSLAAKRLGARVHSFDYDPQSVACAEELKRRYFDGDADWTIEEGSALDREYLAKLGKFDIVYSWGVVKNRGMSPHRDMIDWVGGYPFEVAKPEEIFDFYRDRGFALKKLFTCAGGIGCNQFVFEK